MCLKIRPNGSLTKLSTILFGLEGVNLTAHQSFAKCFYMLMTSYYWHTLLAIMRFRGAYRLTSTDANCQTLQLAGKCLQFIDSVKYLSIKHLH